MDSRAARILVSAFIVLGFSVYNFATYTSTTSYRSTFTLQPGLAYELQMTLSPSDTISGAFQENSGLSVAFYILSSAQFAAHQAQQPFTYLYSVPQTPSGTFSYTVSAQDTYYLFFDHGSGLANNTEIVYAVRDYTTHISYRLFLGIFFLVAAVADFYFAYRYRKKAVLPPPFMPPASPPPFTSPP